MKDSNVFEYLTLLFEKHAGLQLDYSDELIGGGFQFANPNADDSCGCGKSFSA